MQNLKNFHNTHFTAILFFLIFILFFCCASTFQSKQLSEAEKSWLIKKGEIIFVSQTVYPPFEFVDSDNSREGMCIELVRWIATELGFKARFRDMPFKAAQQAIITGEADVLTSLFYSKERDKKFDFTQMTWDVPALIFVQSARPDITGIKDLRGKRIAMQRGDYASEFLQSKKINYELVPTATFAEAVDKVVDGKADAVIGDKQIVLFHLFSNKLTEKIKSVGDALYTGQNCMGVKEDAAELQSILNKGMKLAKDRGVFSTITQKWTGTHYSNIPPWYYQYLSFFLVILTGFFILACFILLWNAQLRRTVGSKTRELRKSETFLRTLIETIPDLIWIKNQEGVYLGCNPKFERFFGAKQDAIIGKTDYDFVDSAMADFFRAKDLAAMAANKPSMNEEEITYADDGHKESLETIKTPMYDQNGKLIGVLGIARDITDRKLANKKLREYSDTQTVLFREVNHRVKNNLTAIISILNQEKDRAKKENKKEYISRLNEVIGRVQGLFTVHSLLSSSQWQPLHLTLLCENVITGSLQILHTHQSVSIDISPSEILVDSDQAHYLAIVLNELATNTIKYAFQGSNETKIKVSIHTQNNSIELLYQDNGAAGYPSSILHGEIPSTCIGHNLIIGIVRKSLQGDIEFFNDNGATARITFPQSCSEQE